MDVSHVVEQEDGTWKDTVSLSYGMRHTRVPREIYFQSTRGPLSTTSDHLIPLSLLTTMVTGDSLRVRGSVSPLLMSNLPQIQTLLRAFTSIHKQDLPEIEVQADEVRAQDWPEGRGVACFFSGGVDSMYSAIRFRDKLDALVFIHGFDMDVRDDEWRRTSAERVQRSAAEIGLPLIEIVTNMSRFMGRASSWTIADGPALATVALLLRPMFRQMHFAASNSYSRLFAAGVHPMLDPLWSTEGFQVVHSGGDVERWQKIQYLANNEIAQKHLRICFERASAPYNCGECAKCLTTMVTLAALGVLDKFQVFAKPLNLEAVANIDAANWASRLRIEDTLAILDGPDGRPFPELRQALIQSLERRIALLSIGRTQETSKGAG